MSLEKILTKTNLELSKEIDRERIPEHVAIIMDGNGRWATNKGLPRSFGHNKGKLERPITSSRLDELLINLLGNKNSLVTSKTSLNKSTSSQKTSTNDNITNKSVERNSNKSENFSNIND